MAEAEPTKYGDDSAEVILGQGFVALGQGTDGMRVSAAAIRLARTLCAPVIDKITKDWDQHAAEALEVVRTIGRVAAAIVLQDGRVEIDADDLFAAAERVVRHRKSIICLALKHEMRGKRR